MYIYRVSSHLLQNHNRIQSSTPQPTNLHPVANIQPGDKPDKTISWRSSNVPNPPSFETDIKVDVDGRMVPLMDLLNLYVKIFPFKVSLILSWFVLFEDSKKKLKSRITGLLVRVCYLGLQYILWALYTVFPNTISRNCRVTYPKKRHSNCLGSIDTSTTLSSCLFHHSGLPPLIMDRGTNKIWQIFWSRRGRTLPRSGVNNHGSNGFLHLDPTNWHHLTCKAAFASCSPSHLSIWTDW